MDLLKLKQFVEAMENDIRIHHAGDDVDKAIAIVNHYERKYMGFAVGVRELREDFIVWMRSVGILMETIGNAATHAEKNARIRGLIEFAETCIERIRNIDIDQQYGGWQSESIWHSKYPVREILERNHKLKDRLDKMTKIAREHGAEIPEKEEFWT